MNWLSKFVAFQRRRRKIFKHYKRIMGHSLNLTNPVYSYEKIQYRKLFGNHEFYALMSDKYKVREFVAERVGDKYLIPLLGVFDRLSPEVFVGLPDHFIIKCNHGCKWHRIVRDKSLLNVNETVRYFNEKCQCKFSRVSNERHYDFIEPKIIIEQLLDDNGEQPWDYNIFSYNGRNGFDFAISISSPDLSVTAHFDRHWNLWETNFTDEHMKKYAKPQNYDEMVEVARLLSTDFDFVRVDLYNIDGSIYFGELTCTPSSGLTRINNKFREKMRSEMWELAVDDRRLYQKKGFIAD
jgi:TupA-like ATPgrasp